MKTHPKILLFALLLIVAGLVSCIKQETYPTEPVIRYEGFGLLPDISGYDSLGFLVISYTDGDGDIGLYDYDTVEPYKYNYYMRFYYMKNKELVEVLPVDTNLSFNSRIPILTPTGKNKNIKGEIGMDIDLYYARALLKSDTIAFEVYIKDRALHTSNVVQTPLIIIKKP